MGEKNQAVIMGVGHLAHFFIPLLKDDYFTYGVSRSFSSKDIDEKFEYICGQDIPTQLPKDPHVVIWNYPPNEKLLNTLKKAENYFSPETTYIFVSSTSIYGDHLANENSELNRHSRLFTSESYLKTLAREVIVLRPGGLFDKTRHPARFFKNKTQVAGGLSPVNMTHCQDLARFIGQLLSTAPLPTSNVYNVVSSTHPTKKDFYNKALKIKNWLQPQWEENKSSNKIVVNIKSKSTGFKYLHDDLLKALEDL